jgi:hypothetical protein
LNLNKLVILIYPRAAQKLADDEKAHFIQILNAYDAEHDRKPISKKSKRQSKAISEVRANISQQHDWAGVFEKLQAAQDDYKNPKGLKKIGMLFRKVGDNQSVMEPLIDFIPQGNYTSVLCGGLKFIVGVS